MNIRTHGFTVVELLIVIVVIGILAALVLNTFAGIQDRAHNTSVINDMKSVHTQVTAYQAINGEYPTTVTAAELGILLDSLDINLAQDSYSTQANTNLLYIDNFGENYTLLGTSKSGTSFVVGSENSTPREWTSTSNPYPGGSFNGIKNELGYDSESNSFHIYHKIEGGFRIWND